MQINELDGVDQSYEHVYLSPHLDDAALCCGGAIVSQRAAGRRVLVATLCTAVPPAAGPFSALAQQFHHDWGLGPEQVVAARLVEDQRAMERLGVDYWWAGMLDAIYRVPMAYNSRESLFGMPAPDDPLLPALRALLGALGQRFPQAIFYAPLAIGHHVDHQITHRVAHEILDGQLWFYEDLPYVNWPGAMQRRFAELGDGLHSRVLVIDPALATKLDAIKQYASQLGELFGGPEAMEHSVAAYAQSVQPDGGRYGERQWRFFNGLMDRA